MITLWTQELGTGKWVKLQAWIPGTFSQKADAREKAEVLRALGFYAKLTTGRGDYEQG